MSYCAESHVLLCRLYIDLLYYCCIMNKCIALCVTTSFPYLSLELQILVLENNSLQSDSNILVSEPVEQWGTTENHHPTNQCHLPFPTMTHQSIYQ